MSRALNLDAALADVNAKCAKLNAPITAIEPLRSGGTRVVLKNANDALTVAKAFGSKVMTGAVTRQPTRLLHHHPAEPVTAAPRPRYTRD